MRKGTPHSSFMPLPLNFSEKSSGNEVISNSGLKLLVFKLYELDNNIFMNEKKAVAIQDCYYGMFTVLIKYKSC